MAKMKLGDYDTELVARGFGGFAQATRYRYVNWAYQRIAMKTRASWEESIKAFTIAAGSYYYDLASSLPTFRSMIALESVSSDRLYRLDPMTSEEFFDHWAMLDLTAAQYRSNPGSYFIWKDRLHLLPPPSSSQNFELHYWAKVAELTTDTPGTTDVLITPQEYDEAVLLAALIICHRRANEVDDASRARQELEEFFGIILTEDFEKHADDNDRVVPDRR